MRPAFFLLLILFLGCKKENSCEQCLTGQSAQLGKVVYSGAPELDGCGWNILIGSDWYHAENLESSFKEENLEVELDYNITGQKYVCGLGGMEMPVITITLIRKK